MPVLRIDGLTAGYRSKVPVVRDISLSVLDRQIISILGANGAGKTTLLRAVLGLCTVQGGRILLAEANVTRLSVAQRVKRGLTLVPQGHQLFGSLSVVQNLLLGASDRPRSAQYESLSNIFSLFPVMEARREQRADSLSGGERAMLAIGRGLMSNPRVLLLDEPSLGLSPLARRVMFERLVWERDKTGISILMAEQDATHALEISDHAYILRNGEVIREGRSDEFVVEALREAYLGL